MLLKLHFPNYWFLQFLVSPTIQFFFNIFSHISLPFVCTKRNPVIVFKNCYKESIALVLIEHLNCSQFHQQFKSSFLPIFLRQKIAKPKCVKNMKKVCVKCRTIDKFFIWLCFAQLLSSYILSLNFFGKNIVKKGKRKMLIKIVTWSLVPRVENHCSKSRYLSALAWRQRRAEWLWRRWAHVKESIL